jgi:hypothetical protein
MARTLELIGTFTIHHPVANCQRKSENKTIDPDSVQKSRIL